MWYMLKATFHTIQQKKHRINSKLKSTLLIPCVFNMNWLMDCRFVFVLIRIGEFVECLLRQLVFFLCVNKWHIRFHFANREREKNLLNKLLFASNFSNTINFSTVVLSHRIARQTQFLTKRRNFFTLWIKYISRNCVSYSQCYPQ